MGWASHALFYLAPLSVVLTIGLLFKTVHQRRSLWMAAPFWIWLVAIIATVVVAAVRTRHGQLRADLRDHRQAYGTLAAYIGGLLVAMSVRIAEGPLVFGDFYKQAGPVVAGFVVAIVFQQTKRTSRDHASLRAREFSVVYILAGAICSLLGLFPGAGFTFFVFYLAIFGSLGSSCYAIVQTALAPTSD
jgi:type IV secretory pathway TrbD component